MDVWRFGVEFGYQDYYALYENRKNQFSTGNLSTSNSNEENYIDTFYGTIFYSIFNNESKYRLNIGLGIDRYNLSTPRIILNFDYTSTVSLVASLSFSDVRPAFTLKTRIMLNF
jgi:hypothetical protein